MIITSLRKWRYFQIHWKRLRILLPPSWKWWRARKMQHKTIINSRNETIYHPCSLEEICIWRFGERHHIWWQQQEI